MGYNPAMEELFPTAPDTEALAEGAVLLRGFANNDTETLMGEVAAIAAASPFRHMVTTRGFAMSAAMTNCGRVGWISDRSGYRYDGLDPENGRNWPEMPAAFSDLAARAAREAGFDGFAPDSCLINRYAPDARMGLHQDRDERDLSAPIVSVSLGLPAVFLFGGATRKVRPRRVALQNGDVVVWGGPSRLFFHGIAPVSDGAHPLTGRCRINLTFRKAL